MNDNTLSVSEQPKTEPPSLPEYLYEQYNKHNRGQRRKIDKAAARRKKENLKKYPSRREYEAKNPAPKKYSFTQAIREHLRQGNQLSFQDNE